LIILLSYLMVSNIPLLGLKFKDYSFRGNMPKWILVLVAILSAVLFKWLAVPLVFIAYILLSLLFKKQSA
jgi:CDP-diacylglycerol---serine O-phosphatidyltransferase